MTELRVCPYLIEVPACANTPMLKPLIRLGYKDCDFITASKDGTLAFYGYQAVSIVSIVLTKTDHNESFFQQVAYIYIT